MYELPSGLLAANPLDRYLLNSPMLPDLAHDAFTLYIQRESPGQDRESNWLSAPHGPVRAALVTSHIFIKPPMVLGVS